jgi:hypothetical protein
MNFSTSFGRTLLVASALAAGASLAGCSGSAEEAITEDGFGSSTEAWTEASTGTFDAGRLALVNTFARPFDMQLAYGDRGGCLLMSRQTFALVYPGYEYRIPRCYSASDRQAVSAMYASPASPFEMPDRYIVNPDPAPNFTLRVTDLGLNSLSASMQPDGLHLRGSLRIRFRATSWLVNPWAELSNVAVDARIVTNRGYLSADQVTVNLGSWYAECGAGNWCVGYVSNAISAQRVSLETTMRNMLNGFLYKPETFQYVYGTLERVENTVNRPAGAAPWIVGLGSLRFEGGAFRYDMRRVGASSTPNCEVRVACGTTATVQCTANADRISLAEGTRAIATNATSGEGAATRFIDRNLRMDGKAHRYTVCAMSDDARGTEVNRSCTTVAFTAVEAANCKSPAPAAPALPAK